MRPDAGSLWELGFPSGPLQHPSVHKVSTHRAPSVHNPKIWLLCKKAELELYRQEF